MGEIRGTVFARPNGTFTVQAEPTWDPKQTKFRRTSLGTFKTRTEAEAVRLRYSVSQADGVFLLSEIDLRRVRLSTYLADWLELVDTERRTEKITLRTQRDYEAVVRCHIVPYLGHRRIGELRTPMLHRWLLDIKGKGASDRTVQKAYRTLHRAMADCDLKENPAKLPKRYRPLVRDRRLAVYPTASEVNAFVSHGSECDRPYGRARSVMWRIAATSGIRRGELVGLAWPDVDLNKGTISITQTIQPDRGSLYVKGPKSTKGYRTIGLDTATGRHLRRHRTRMLEERTAAGAGYDVTPLGHDWVFRADESGAPIHPDHVTRAFRREWAHAGLEPGPTLQGLRHTNGSLLLLNGVPGVHVATHLGHDLQVLTTTYAHELDSTSRQEAVAVAIGDVYR